MSIRVPYIDFSLLPENLKKDIFLEIGRIMRFRNVQEHEQFVAGVEMSLAQYFQTRFVVAVDSGTTALQLSLAALGVGEGDEVIVPTYTYVATALAVTNLGARPVFVDVKMEDLTISPDLIAANITSKTKAVVPVHIHGLCCDIQEISQICQKHKIAMLEDASQAHGASINGKKVGSSGIGCFSLHTSKNLGGIGDAGFIALNDESLYKTIKQFLLPESGTKAALESRRTPCTMDAIQAAIVHKKLAFLDVINESKRKIANYYDALIVNTEIRKPVVLQGSSPAYRDYFILVDDRQSLRSYLLKEGIETKLGYTPLHLLKTFEDFAGNKNNFPIADMIADKAFLLPSFWGMTDSQLKHVCAILRGSKNVRS